jgi:hypothetical protein
VNGPGYGRGREVQLVLDELEGAWLVLGDDQEDLGEVGIEVSGFQDCKQAQSPVQLT